MSVFVWLVGFVCVCDRPLSLVVCVEFVVRAVPGWLAVLCCDRVCLLLSVPCVVCVFGPVGPVSAGDVCVLHLGWCYHFVVPPQLY